MGKKVELLKRVYVLLVLFALTGMLLFYKTIKISVVEGEKWRSLGDSLYLDYKPIRADRGDILAEDGKLLATSLPFFEIRMDLRATGLTDELFNSEVDSLAWYLSRYVDQEKSQKEYRDHLVVSRQKNNRYLLIKRKANFPEMKRMKSFPIFRYGSNTGGFIVKRKTVRNKPFNALASRTIGRYNGTQESKGLENSFNEYLAGKDGQSLMKRVSYGVWLPLSDDSKSEPIKGSDIRTTINVNMQDVAQYALLNGIRNSGADKGVAVVMEVKTGAIKAIVNLRKTRVGGWSEVYNDAVLTATEPGSTFKLASVMAMMQDGYANLRTKVNLKKGAKKFYKQWMHDSSPHSITTSDLAQAFAISSNVGVASLATRYYKGNEKGFVERIKSFGLDDISGIDLKGESKPLVKTAWDKSAGWSGLSLPWMATGYEVRLTPLQILKFYNSVANDGVMMKPYLVSEILKDGLAVKRFEPIILNEKIADAKVIKNAQSLLKDVVQIGTGKIMKSAKCSVAGKTGTAQVNYGSDKETKYQASFVGYFPAEEPVYSCIVVLYNIPKDKPYYGSSAAGPIFKEIVNKIYLSEPDFIKSIPREKETLLYAGVGNKRDAGYVGDMEVIMSFIGMPYVKDDSSNWIELTARKKEVLLSKRQIEKGKVPSVIGMGIRDATYVLENSGLKVIMNGVGKVKRQSLKPGAKRIRGQEIILELK